VLKVPINPIDPDARDLLQHALARTLGGSLWDGRWEVLRVGRDNDALIGTNDRPLYGASLYSNIAVQAGIEEDLLAVESLE